ncbi:hypothetical protein QJS66_13510 [Kocuria rhizophila]|nr:hypothetical protein QJS66_13510 [Kocuria rhizophila]
MHAVPTMPPTGVHPGGTSASGPRDRRAGRSTTSSRETAVMTTTPVRTAAPAARGPVSTALLDILTGPDTPDAAYRGARERRRPRRREPRTCSRTRTSSSSPVPAVPAALRPGQVRDRGPRWTRAAAHPRGAEGRASSASCGGRLHAGPYAAGRRRAGGHDVRRRRRGGRAHPGHVAQPAPSEEILREFLIHRYRVHAARGRPALVGIAGCGAVRRPRWWRCQSDEYGGGRPSACTPRSSRRACAAWGLDDTLDHYLDLVPAPTLASHERDERLRAAPPAGAITGTSGVDDLLDPNSTTAARSASSATARTSPGTTTAPWRPTPSTAVAAGTSPGRWPDEPELLEDVLFGAAACLYVDGLMGNHMLECWSNERSSLRADDAAGAAL